jgi:hypothetical protein
VEIVPSLVEGGIQGSRCTVDTSGNKTDRPQPVCPYQGLGKLDEVIFAGYAGAPALAVWG